jgi:hypothetical protein
MSVSVSVWARDGPWRAHSKCVEKSSESPRVAPPASEKRSGYLEQRWPDAAKMRREIEREAEIVAPPGREKRSGRFGP